MTTTRIGINGFGRIGRLGLRAAWDWPELEFVHIDELKGDAGTAAHLLTFDSRLAELTCKVSEPAETA